MSEYDPAKFAPKTVWNPVTHQWEDLHRKNRTINNREQNEKDIEERRKQGYGIDDIKLPAFPPAQGAGQEKYLSAEDHARVQQIAEHMQAIQKTGGGEPPEITALRMQRLNAALRRGAIPAKIATQVAQLEHQIRMDGKRSAGKHERQMFSLDKVSTSDLWKMNPQTIDQTRQQKLQAIEAAQPAVDALFTETAKNYSRIMGREVTAAELRNIVKSLSDEQLVAATSKMQAVIITAGPGSGKSMVLQKMAMGEIGNARTPQEALEKAKSLTVLSQTHSAVNNFMDKMEKMRQLVPGWTEEQLRSQGKTLPSWGMSMLTRGQTMGSADNPVSILQILAEKTGMHHLSPLYQGGKGKTIEADMEKKKQEEMLLRVFERHQIKGQGGNLARLAQRIAEIKGAGTVPFRQSMEAGKELYSSKAHEQSGPIHEDLALYLYQQALRHQRGFNLPDQSGPRFDINDVPHMLLYAANQGMFKPSGTIISDETQDNPPVYGELFAAMGKINPKMRFLMGGDPSQMAVQRPWDFDEAAEAEFGPERASRHFLTVNYRSGPYAVAFLNAINALSVMGDQPKSPMQISFAGPGSDKSPVIRTERDQPALYRAMFGDWMEHMQTSLPQLKEGMEMGDPFGSTRFLPGEAPFQFMMGENERDIFMETLPQILSEVMSPEMTKEFMQKHVTKETPSLDSIMKIHALTTAQSRGREFPAVFSDFTYGGAWDQVGLNKQMYTMGSRATAGGVGKNFFYGSLSNIGRSQHDLTPSYFAGQQVMGGFDQLLQATTEDMAIRQGHDPSEMDPAYRMAWESNPRIMYHEGEQEAAERRGPAADPAMIDEYIKQVRYLAGYHSAPVGVGKGSGIQQGDSRQYSAGDPVAKSHIRIRGSMSAENVTGQTRRGGQNQRLIDYASRMADQLVRLGTGDPVPTPHDFMSQMKSSTAMIPYKLIEEIQREAPSEIAESDNRKHNFVQRDWLADYQGRDDKNLLRSVRLALNFPGFAQSPEIMTRAAQYYTHPLVTKMITGMGGWKDSKDKKFASLQKQIRMAWMPEDLVRQRQQRIDELIYRQEREGKLPKALQGLNIGKGADVSKKALWVGKELTEKEKQEKALRQKELASLQADMRNIGPAAQQRIIAAIADPKMQAAASQGNYLPIIHHKAIELLAGSRIDPDFLEELARRAYQVKGTLEKPRQKELMESIARQFASEAKRMRDDGTPLTHKMLSHIRKKDPAQAMLLARIFTDPETGDLLPYNHPHVTKQTAQIGYLRGSVERGKGAQIGMPIAYSRTAPARTQLRSLYTAMQGGLWEGNGSGVLDRDAVRAVARPNMNPNNPIDDHFDFPEYGIGAPLHAQRQRYTEMLKRGGMTKIKRSELEHKLSQVHQVESGFGSEENQRNWGHTLQIMTKAASGEDVMDRSKGDDFDRDPIRRWFEHREDTFKDHRSLESIIHLMESLQQATHHIQKTGTVNREHLDQLVGAFGYSPDDKKMTGLRRLEKEENFKGNANLPLQRLIGQFPDDTKNMQEILTRLPLSPELSYAFRGGEKGFGGMTIAQENMGIPVGASIEGTLHPYAEGEPFGVAKYGAIHLGAKMFSEPDRQAFSKQSDEVKSRNFMPLLQFQGTHEGNPITFPVTPEQLSLVPAARQQQQVSLAQAQQEAHWGNVRQKNREEDAYSPETMMRLSNPRPRYALDPSPALGQHGFYTYDQMRAIEPQPGNPLWIGQGQIDAGGGYDWNQPEAPFTPTLHGEGWGAQDYSRSRLRLYHGLLRDQNQKGQVAQQLVGLTPQLGRQPLLPQYAASLQGTAREESGFSLVHEPLTHPDTIAIDSPQRLMLPSPRPTTHIDRMRGTMGMDLDTYAMDQLMQDAPTLERGSGQSLLGITSPTVGQSYHPASKATFSIPGRPQGGDIQQPSRLIEPPAASSLMPSQAALPPQVSFPQSQPTYPLEVPAVQGPKRTQPPRTAQAAYDIVRERATGYRVPDRPSGPRGSDLNYALWVHQKTQAFLPARSSYISNPTKGRLLLPQHAASRIEAVRNMRPRFHRASRPRRRINRGRVADVVPLGPEHHPPLQLGGPASPLLLPQHATHWRRAQAQSRLDAARQGVPSSSSAIALGARRYRLSDVPSLLRGSAQTVAGVKLRQLSKEQLDVLNSEEKHQVIQGGPGTGKTDIAVMRQLDQIAQGKLQAPGIRSFSGLHSGVDEINDRYEKLLRPLLPSGEAYQVPPAGTVHSFAHQIVFPHGEASPLLQDIGWGHLKNIISNPSEEDLATMSPEEASIKKNQQYRVLRSAMKSAYPPGTKMPLANEGLESVLKDISKWKQSRSGPGALYDANMSIGLDDLNKGTVSNQGFFAAYEKELPRQQVGDYSDLITAARQMLQVPNSGAVPPELANTQQIFYDEQQDAPPEQMALLHAFQKATGAQMLVGLDPMQALFQDHAEQNIPSLKRELGGEGFAHHELSVNYRGDKSNVALYNAVLGQSANPLSRPQVANSPLQGQLPQFILGKSEPNLYKKTFRSMLGDTGVPISHITENIAGGRHPFHGVDWDQKSLTKPGQIPIQFSTKSQRKLFEHMGPKVLSELDPTNISPEKAQRAFHQMYRSGVPGKKAYDKEKESFARGEKFSGIMVGQARSRAYDKPVAVVHRAGYWAKDTPEAKESYLNNLGVQVSRVREGGHQTLVAASRPFSAKQSQLYINGASFEETHPESLVEGSVHIGNRMIEGNPNTTHFEQWQGQTVPHGFPQIMSAATTQISDWQAQLASPALPPPSSVSSMAEESQHPLAMPAMSIPQSSLHVFEGNVPPSRMARGMYPQGHPYQPWAVARRMENQQRLAYSPVGRLYPQGGQVPPPLSREASLLALPSPRSQPASDSPQIDVVRGNTPRPSAAQSSQSTRVPLQGEALPAGIGFQKINVAPSGNIKIEGTDIKVEMKGPTSFGAASPGLASGAEQTHIGGFRVAGTGGALGRSTSGGLGTGGNPDIIIDARGGGGSGGKPPLKGSDKDYATPFFNGMQQTGRTLARISSEMQFFGKLFTDITSAAAQQGSEYRRATTGLSGSGATADRGFYDFSDKQSGISQMQASLPMYSDVQVAQTLRNVSAQTGGKGINTGTANAYLQLGAVTGIDPSQLIQQGALYTGVTGQGMSTRGTNKLMASMEGLYGGNLTASNVTPTLQAINTAMPSLQGNALGKGDQLQSLMTLLGAAKAGGANAQNMPDIAGTIANLSQVGMNPDLRQQYTMSKLFPGQVTAGVQLAQFNQQQIGQSEQIKQLSLQKAVDLPGLQIKINNADIAMQSANFDLAQMQQNYNQASYANAQLNQQYSEASFQEKQYVQNQELGPIGADTGRNSYFDFMRNQQAAGYNPLSAETGTQFKASAPQGLQNMQFYAGVEHQRQGLILSRSPLLSDAKFQEDMKYLNKQEAFYKAQLDLTNQQRKFEVDWTTKLLASQGHLLDMQGPMLAQQKKILGIQGQQLDLNKAMTAYQNASLTIQQKYLPLQLDALIAIQNATSEFMNGQGPLRGQNMTPADLIKALATKPKSDAEMRKDVQSMGLSPADTTNIIQIVEGIKKSGGWDSVQKSTKPQDKALQGQIDALSKSGAFTDTSSQAAVQNAYLQFAGTGGSWSDFVDAFSKANEQWTSIAQSLSTMAPIMKDLATFLTVAGPLVMGAALIMNTTGTVGGLASTANKIIPGGAGGAALNPITAGIYMIGGEAVLSSQLPDIKAGGGIGGGKNQNSWQTIFGHALVDSTVGGAGYQTYHQGSQLLSQIPGAWNNLTGWLSGGPNKTTGGGSATRGGINAGSGGLELPHGAIDHLATKKAPSSTERADLGPLMIKSIGASWDNFWKTTASKQLSGFFGTIHGFVFKTLPDWLGGIAENTKKNLSGFAQWLRLEFDIHIVTPFKNAIDGFTTFKDKTLPEMFNKALDLFNPGNKNNIGHMIADVFMKMDWGKIFGSIKWPWSGGGGGASGGGSEPAGHPGFSTPQVNTDFGAKVWYGTGKHQGVDFQAKQGTRLREFVGGEVVKTGFYDWGGEVDVKIPGGLTERYLHLSSIGVKKGDVVGRGQYIGLTGGGTKQSGLGYWSTGAHSHVQYDTGDYTKGVNPWAVWRKFADTNIANFYGPTGLPPGAQSNGGGAGGRGGGAMDGLAHLASGGIAMKPMAATIAEREPEIVVPLSKLSETLKSLNHHSQRTTVVQETASSQQGSGRSITVQNMIGNATFNISAHGTTISDHDKDSLMTEIFELFAEAIKQLNGKL